MGKLVVSQFITVDGVIEDPGGAEQFERGGWAFQFDRGADGDEFKMDEVMAAEVLLWDASPTRASPAAWPAGRASSPTSSTPCASRSCRPRCATPAGTTRP